MWGDCYHGKITNLGFLAWTCRHSREEAWVTIGKLVSIGALVVGLRSTAVAMPSVAVRQTVLIVLERALDIFIILAANICYCYRARTAFAYALECRQLQPVGIKPKYRSSASDAGSLPLFWTVSVNWVSFLSVTFYNKSPTV